MSSPEVSLPKILIIGAGVGGLTLAQALLKHNIPFHIFERDQSVSHRAQGYRIRISGDGVFALQECVPRLVYETLEASAARGPVGITKIDALTGEEIKVGGPPDHLAPPGGSEATGRVGIDSNGELVGIKAGTEPMSIDRTLMRTVLLAELADSIMYGKVFSRYQITDSGVTAYFTDGTSYEGTFLVGADGTNSVVRKQYLPRLKVVDTMGRCIFGKSYITDELTTALSPSAQRNMTLIQQKLENGTPLTLFLEPTRFPNKDVVCIVDKETGKETYVKDYIYWVLLSKSHIFHPNTKIEHRLTSATTDYYPSPTAASSLSIALTSSWHKTLTPLLLKQSTQDTRFLDVLSAVPPMVPWNPSSRVTLLGDAAHPMPPTAGLGAVSALREAGSLLKSILEGPTEQSIGVYEAEMRAWADTVLVEVKKSAEKFFGEFQWEECSVV